VCGGRDSGGSGSGNGIRVCGRGIEKGDGPDRCRGGRGSGGQRGVVDVLID